MECWHRFPSPDLEPLLERIWGWRSAPGERIGLPLLGPGVGAELVIQLGQPMVRREGSGMVALPKLMVWHLGQSPVDLVPQEGIHFVALRIRAGTLRHVVPHIRDAGEGLGDASLLWPGLGMLRERLGTCPEVSQVEILQDWLRSQRARFHKPDPAVQRSVQCLYRYPADSVLDRLCYETGLSARQIQRRFTAGVGLSPKAFQLRTRFYRLIRSCLLIPDRRMLDAGLELGFWDQAHMTHAFRRATGWNLGAFLREARSRTHFYHDPRPAR